MRQEIMGFWDGSGISWTCCTSLQTDNHTSTSPLSFYGPDALPDAQPCQRTEGNVFTYNKMLYKLCCALNINHCINDQINDYSRLHAYSCADG